MEMVLIIVEKSIDIAHEFSYMLLSFGIKSILVANREEALNHIENHQEINLAIIDIDNKNVEGIQLIETLQDNSSRDFRFIIHSAVPIEELPEKINNQNIIGYIPKPFDYKRVESSLKIIFSSINFPDIDKRKHIRIIPDKDDLLRLQCKFKGYSHLLCGRILNLSLGGAAVELFKQSDTDFITEGTPVPVIEFSINCNLVSATGTVFIKKGKIIIIHFNAMERETRNILAKYILKRIS